MESRGFFLIKEFLGERLCNNMREEAQDLFRCVRCLHGCLNMSKVESPTRLPACKLLTGHLVPDINGAGGLV